MSIELFCIGNDSAGVNVVDQVPQLFCQKRFAPEFYKIRNNNKTFLQINQLKYGT